jgi:hypothetical protein
MRVPTADRAAPIVAGLAGLAWFWAELAPQRTGFEDTDNPATGLAFIAAHPDAWVQAGLALLIAALALIATVLVTGDRLEAGRLPAGACGGVAVRGVTVLGLIAAAMLIGMATIRLAGGPVLHVQGLRQEWGEAAYLVTQFVGIQLFGIGGITLLAGWIVAYAWVGVRRGVVPRVVALLAILPAVRLVGLPATGGTDVAPALWLIGLVAVPASFGWLVLVGAWPASKRHTRSEPAAAPNASPSTV